LPARPTTPRLQPEDAAPVGCPGQQAVPQIDGLELG
jgi:hypothetical protein